jgi:Mce-associated membrane protein
VDTDDEPELNTEPELDAEPESEVEVISGSVIGGTEPEPGIVDAQAEKPKPRPGPRPSGKRRATGSARPADLAGAETEVAEKPQPRRAVTPQTTLTVAIGLAVLAVILAGLAVWFRGEANSRSDGADVNNKALIDAAASSEVSGQVQKAVESSFSYNYTDLDSTAKAVKDNLAGKALCQYDKLYGQVQKLAPEQKLVLTTRVVKVGITRLEADRASMLVFLDQTTTRADQNQTTASGAQIGVDAERQGGKWRITNINMLGQPLPNGQPAPQC